MDFAKVETKFKELRREYDAGAITKDELKAQLEVLVVQDQQGRSWMIGDEPGQWYYREGGEWVRSEPPEPAPTVAAAPGGAWRPILLIIIGWAIGLAIGEVLGGAFGGLFPSISLFGPPSISLFGGLAIGGAIGGLITGLALRRAERSIPLKQVPMTTIGGVIGVAAGAVLGVGSFLILLGAVLSDDDSYLIPTFSPLVPIGGAMGLGIGGLIMGLALRRRECSLQWRRVLMIAVGWAIGWRLGVVVGLAVAFRAFVAMASGVYVANMEAMAGAIGGAIGGAITGAIGGGVMFWQLSRARRARARAQA